MPNGVNNVLYNIIGAYNKTEITTKLKKRHRKAELLPKFSAYLMRHTACTRMADSCMDVKVLQYINGYAHSRCNNAKSQPYWRALTRIENASQD